MNVYDKAYELARAIKESGEYKNFQEAKLAVEADADAKRMLGDFRERQAELQKKILAGEKPPEEEMKKMEKLSEVLMLNPLIRRYFEAERRLAVLTEDINRIVFEPLAEALK